MTPDKPTHRPHCARVIALSALQSATAAQQRENGDRIAKMHERVRGFANGGCVFCEAIGGTGHHQEVPMCGLCQVESQLDSLHEQLRTERERAKQLQEALTELLEWAEETEFAHKDDDGTWLWSKSGERIIDDSALSHSGKEGVQEPYIYTTRTVAERRYNKAYGNGRICICGHEYERHFDAYDNMAACGCKYCDCSTFVEANPQ